MNGNLEYELTINDFEEAFDFGVKYFLDDTKSVTDRTSGGPRGLGGVLDAFVNGKLIEIGTKRIIEKNTSKNIELKLNFDIVPTNEVRPEPDIIEVAENDNLRAPRCFIEIKRSSVKDNWLGLTDDQIVSIKEGSSGVDVYTIWTKMEVDESVKNRRSDDIVGLYLKKITGNYSELFKNFSQFKAVCKIDFILPLSVLEGYGASFPKGHLMFDSVQFEEIKSIIKKDGSFYSKINPDKHEKYEDFDGEIKLKVKADQTVASSLKTSNNFVRQISFTVQGTFELFTNNNNVAQYIKCDSDVHISNDVFGKYKLSSGKIYNFYLKTVGRDPVLKRNNVFLCKKRLAELITDNIVPDKNFYLSKIASTI